MSFEQDKKKQLSREDKSNEQKWDKAVSILCKKINLRKEYYTTSSCSGRIVLIKALNEKAEDVFLFKSHEKISFSGIKKAFSSIKYKGLVYFKQETCILHVACSNLNSARELVNKAKFAGWKRSGIMTAGKRIVLELMSTEKLEMPIINKRTILIDDSFLKILVKEANSRLEKTWLKINRLEKLI